MATSPHSDPARSCCQAHDPDHGRDHDQTHDHAQCQTHTHAHDAARQDDPPIAQGEHTTAIRIMQMDCPTEEALLRNALGRLSQVRALRFDLMQRVLTVAHDPGEITPILTAIRDLGYTPQVRTAGQPVQPIEPASRPWWPLALGGLAAAASEALHWLDKPVWATAALAVLAIALCGLGTYKKGWIALRHGMFNINALMSIAVTGAILIGQWAEAAMVMVLFTLAELIEARSLDRARNAISGLMKLTPDKVTRRAADGVLAEVDVADVAVEDVIEVRPGERIGLDGTVLSGQSAVNQSPITGESMPSDKSPGSPLYAGTINGMGRLQYRVTASGNQSTLARIIQAVEQAQAVRAPTQRFVDKFARVYTPAVMLIALAVAILPPLFWGAAWMPWIYKALVLLVIACPCAMVISTPITVVSGLTRAARMGILIKGGAYLERGRLLRVVALDKTGTLTTGRPKQTDMMVFDNDPNTIHAAAIALAATSDHPVSQAIVLAQSDAIVSTQSDSTPASGSPADIAQTKGLCVTEVQAVAGQGIRADIDGVVHALGNRRMASVMGHTSGPAIDAIEALERAGKTVVLFMTAERVLALFAVADTLKPESREAVATLHSMGLTTIMLTGDNTHTAAAIGEQAGVGSYKGEQLPQDKLDVMASLAGEGRVAMVGDGINDAPALARADISFAMGAVGSDSAIETADVALMNDDLRNVPAFIQLSRKTHRVLVQNITMALGIKAVFLVLTLVGMGSMWMAVFADVGASLLVIANGLRVMRA